YTTLFRSPCCHRFAYISLIRFPFVAGRVGKLPFVTRNRMDPKEFTELAPVRIDKRIVLIDGEQLASFMYDYGIGVSTSASYAVSTSGRWPRTRSGQASRPGLLR